MADNFDLKKFLKESKALENLNPVVAKGNLSEGDIRSKIREYILNELAENDPNDDDPEGMAYGDYYDDEEKYYPSVSSDLDLYDEPVGDYYEDELEEAKKKDEEEVEVEDTETEEAPADEMPAGGGLEDIAADMEGTEGELMDSLMKAFKIAKGMNNEKLETQVGNTLKFFVSEYIGGGED